MGYKSTYADVEKIQLTHPDYWVQIKTCLSRGALGKAEGALTRASVKQGETEQDADVSMAPDISEYRDLMVLGSIITWNLDDDRGQVLPITLENVGELSGPDFALVYARVDALNSPMKPEEEKKFPDQG